MIKKYFICLLLILISIFIFTGCGNKNNDKIYGGYSEVSLIIEEDDNYYISGYSGGRYFTDILDYQKAKAFYLNYYGE